MDKKISRANYLAAKRVILAYERQEKVGKYQFLYWLREEDWDDAHEKYISAKDIDDACKKFLAWMPTNVQKVDYEVMFDGQYIDITHFKGFENIIL